MDEAEVVYRSDVISSSRKYAEALRAWREIEDVPTPEPIRRVVSSNLYEKRVDLLKKLLANPGFIKDNLEVFLTSIERNWGVS